MTPERDSGVAVISDYCHLVAPVRQNAPPWGALLHRLIPSDALDRCSVPTLVFRRQGHGKEGGSGKKRCADTESIGLPAPERTALPFQLNGSGWVLAQPSAAASGA
jgi:hypothetical protein